MIKNCLMICGLLLVLCTAVQAQKKFTVSGYMRDAKTGEALIGAIVYVPKLHVGTTTNNYGFYSLTLPQDSQVLVYSYLGYVNMAKKLFLKENVTITVDLEPKEDGKVIEVTANRARENVEKPQMGVIDVPIAAVKELPAIGGEKDLFKILQLLPGVQAGSEASANFYVRGGGPDQNLVLLDEAIVYSPFHLFGFFSTFNTDALKSVDLIKGGFPAQYGGRLSSVIDVSMKEGSDKGFHASGGIGLIASHLTLEGPIIKNKASFMVSARRTYIDALIRPFEAGSGTTAGYYFYDLNAKINYKFSEKDRVYLSGYMGKDVLYLSDHEDSQNPIDLNINWGNKTFTARWNHLFSDKLFCNTSFIYNDYLFKISDKEHNNSINLTSGIRDINGKTDFEWFASTRHRVRFGAFYVYQRFIPQVFQDVNNFNNLTISQTRFVTQAAAYINDEISVSKRLSVNAGLRLPVFIYKSTQYYSAEPRLTARYTLDQSTSVKAAYCYMNQYIHLLSNSTASLPTDLWIPSSNVVKPQQAQQVSAGIFHNFLHDAYESSVELYYKNMTNQIEYKEGAQVFLNPDVEKEITFGRGWSYGAEFFLKKNEGKITGWIGYTLAWAWRNFPELNSGQDYYAKYDRRHDLSIAAVYAINKQWSASCVFVFGSGSSISLPFGNYVTPLYQNGSVDYTQVQDYVQRNYFKLKPYNRLDIGIKRTIIHKKWNEELRFDIYNVYSRNNPYFMYVSEAEVDPRSNIMKPVVKQVSILPMIPSISYNFVF